MSEVNASINAESSNKLDDEVNLDLFFGHILDIFEAPFKPLKHKLKCQIVS